MAFRNENTEAKIAVLDRFQVGRSNVDRGATLEQGVFIPWASDPQASWVYYDCTVGVLLDSGIAVHNRLPQVDGTADTLSTCDLDDPNMDSITQFGVNLRCRDQYRDIAQRMGHARYWFRLWGQALRIGYKIPIPSIVRVGGVLVTPYDKNPQWAFNRIAPGGNYGGVPLWHAQWSLWYTTLDPPFTTTIPAADPSAHISERSVVPQTIQAPYSSADGDALPSRPKPPALGGNIVRG